MSDVLTATVLLLCRVFYKTATDPKLSYPCGRSVSLFRISQREFARYVSSWPIRFPSSKRNTSGRYAQFYFANVFWRLRVQWCSTTNDEKNEIIWTEGRRNYLDAKINHIYTKFAHLYHIMAYGYKYIIILYAYLELLCLNSLVVMS